MPDDGRAECATLNGSTVRTIVPLTAIYNGHLQSGVHRTECPILFTYGDSSVGIAAAYGGHPAFLVAGNGISELVDFYGSHIHNLNPPRGGLTHLQF